MRMLEHPMLLRDGMPLSLLAMLAWFAQSLASLLLDEPTRALDATFAIPALLTLAPLAAIIAIEGRHGRLRRIGAPLALWGLLLTAPAQVIVALDIDALWLAMLPVGSVLWLLGMLLLGIAIVRDGTLPRRVGVMLIVAQPLAVLCGLALSPISPLASHGDHSGAIGHGLVWLVVALALRDHERQHARARAAEGSRSARLDAIAVSGGD